MFYGRIVELFSFSSVSLFKRQVSVRCGACGYIPRYFRVQGKRLLDPKSPRPDWTA